MNKWRFSRREVLQGNRIRAGAPPSHRPFGRRRRRRRDHDQKLIDAAKKEGKVVWYTAVDLPVAERSERRSKRNIPASRCAWSAAAPSACSSASGRNIPATSMPSTSSTRPTPRISSSGSATASWRPMCRRTWPSTSRPSTRIRTACSPASVSGLRGRLQHQPGEERGGAQELQGPARPEMVRQDGQGASGLQRQ